MIFSSTRGGGAGGLAIMRLPLCFLLMLGSILRPVSAQESPAPAKEIMQRLFGQGASEAELLALIKEANHAGIPRQQVIEAKLIWGLRHQDAAFLMKILPEVEILASSYDPAFAAVLTDVQSVQAFVAYINALKAQGGGDGAAFKQNILEAIWLNPQQAPVFLQTIEKHRLETKMKSLVVDLKLPLTTSQGEATTLGDQLGSDGKALLIDFWASWCGPCMSLMPALKKKAAVLRPHGIIVAAMNKDEQDAEATAERIRREQGADFPWLVEPSERPYTKAFDVRSIPRMILLSPEGKVLFNGHPEDPALWTEIQKIAPQATKP